MRKNKSVIALGFFDGVHLGHQALLKECCSMAQELGVQAAAITFDAHPMSLFSEAPPLLINTVEDRETLLRQYGIGKIYRLPVTREVMCTPWQDFLRQLVENGAVGFVCGNDFRFGYRGQGDAEKLTQVCQVLHLPCRVVEDQKVDGLRVSSSYIRKLLEAGQLEEAVRFLGHPHILSGTVVSGRHLGRTIGVPTANLELPKEVLCPRAGVYACIAEVGKQQHMAVTNIGTRPTVGGSHITVEPWILNFEGDLYRQRLTLQFHKFLRPERKFASLEELRGEILKNAEETQEFFRKT